MFIVSSLAQLGWSQDAGIAAWLEGTRLNVSRGISARRKEPENRAAMHRTRDSMATALQNFCAYNRCDLSRLRDRNLHIGVAAVSHRGPI